MSCLPISMNLPKAAQHFQFACKASPVSEFKTTSTPFPPVAAKTPERKLVLYDVKIFSLGTPGFFERCSAFSSVETVAKICYRRLVSTYFQTLVINFSDSPLRLVIEQSAPQHDQHLQLLSESIPFPQPEAEHDLVERRSPLRTQQARCT